MTVKEADGLVLVGVDTDRSTSTDPDLQRAVEEAEAEVAEGRLVDHDEMMEKLRRWADE